MRCRICDNAEINQVFQIREMMFGYRDLFTYFQCANCNCLQISEIPSDISKYYPSNYISLSKTKFDMASDFIKLMAEEELRYYFSAFGVTREMRVLDVGCGSGFSVYALKEIGFSKALGVDLYIDGDIEHQNGAKIIKGTIQDINQEFDVITFIHSFEHLAEPVQALQKAAQLLPKNGLCLVRMPVFPSYAWEHYGPHWAQLDAPRHFVIYSIETVKRVARKAGLQLKRVLYDSSGFQFWASEQYRQDIPLFSEKSYWVNPSNSIFSQEQMEAFGRMAKQLNNEKRGDQAAFYLVKK